MLDFSKAIELSPDVSDTYFNRATSYCNLGDYECAILDLSKAIELSPDFINAYYNRGRVYYDMKCYDEAIKDFGKVLELDSEFERAYANRGRSFFAKGDYRRALEDANEAIRLEPSRWDNYYSRCQANVGLSKLAKATKDFLVLMQFNCTDVDLCYDFGILARKCGLIVHAISYFSKAIELDPNRSDLYLERAVTYEKSQGFKMAQKDYMKVSEFFPDDLDLKYKIKRCKIKNFAQILFLIIPMCLTWCYIFYECIIYLISLVK